MVEWRRPSSTLELAAVSRKTNNLGISGHFILSGGTCMTIFALAINFLQIFGLQRTWCSLILEEARETMSSAVSSRRKICSRSSGGRSGRPAML